MKIVFTGENEQQQTLYYFSTDLSDKGTENSGFLKFCEQWRNAAMPDQKCILSPARQRPFRACAIFSSPGAQPSCRTTRGIPLKDFDLGQWDLRPFGNYVKPIPIFSGNYQSDLLTFFTEQHAAAAGFSIGYQWRNNGSSVLLATKKPGRREEASSETQAPTAETAKGR